MLPGFNFSKLVLLSTLTFTYSNASNSQFLHYQAPIFGVCCAHRIKLIVTWLFHIVQSRENHQNDWKTIRVAKKTFFTKNATHLFF